MRKLLFGVLLLCACIVEAQTTNKTYTLKVAGGGSGSADLTAVYAALNGKLAITTATTLYSPITHAHPEADVTGLIADLTARPTAVFVAANYAAFSHLHPESAITGLVADLAARPTATTIAGSYSPLGHTHLSTFTGDVIGSGSSFINLLLDTNSVRLTAKINGLIGAGGGGAGTRYVDSLIARVRKDTILYFDPTEPFYIVTDTLLKTNTFHGYAATTTQNGYVTFAKFNFWDAKLSANGNGSALTGLTSTQVGLSNVNNTSDISKPVSTLQQNALNLKENSLGNPSTNGYVLSSTSAGVRSWIAPAAGTGTTGRDSLAFSVIDTLVGSAGFVLKDLKSHIDTVRFRTDTLDVTNGAQTRFKAKRDSLLFATSFTAIKRMSLSSVVTGTDANITAAPGVGYRLPVSTLTTSRTINIAALNAEGDYMEISNNEAAYAWTVTGGVIYLSDNVTTTTTIPINTTYQLRVYNGHLKIIN